MAKHEAVWVVTSSARVRGYGYEVLGCFTKKWEVTKFLREWLPRRRWKFPEDTIEIRRFPMGFQPGWRTVEAPYQMVTNEFLYWDPEGTTYQGPGWRARKKPATTLGMVTDKQA